MKRFFCILCTLFLFISLPAQAQINNFYLRTRYGQLVPYENLVFNYSIDVYSGFYMFSDTQLNTLWDNLQLDETDDMVYDFRYWISPDNTYEFQVQVKEQTYDSFEAEVLHAPEFVALAQDDLKAQGFTNIRQLHNGILRDTPEGKMLETAYALTAPVDSGSLDITIVYYDCYYQDIEYIFKISSYNGNYETAQYLLDQMVQTVDIWPAQQLI